MVKLFFKVIKKVIKYIILISLYPIIFVIFTISVLFIKLKSLFRKKPCVALGPTPLVNIYYWSKALNKVKIKNSTIVYTTFPGFENIKFDYDFSWTFKIRYADIFTPILHILIFLWIINKFNIFIFDFSGGFLQHTYLKKLEFPLLKILSKKIIMYPYGADAFDYHIKDPYDKYNNRERYVTDYPHMKKIRNFSRVKYLSRYADKIISSARLPYLPTVNHYKHSLCIDVNKFKPHYPIRDKKKKIIIVHAPNHKFIKGSDIIIRIVKKMEKKYPIEFRLFERIKYNQALKEYSNADIIIDQIILGVYGLTAIEAMALGKPVLCYLRKDMVEPVKQIKYCPLVNTNPDTLEKNLIKLISSPSSRYKLGKKSRKYALKYHSLEHIGEFFKNIILDI